MTMDIDFYPDKNRVIRLIKEVANGQYKGDLNAVSKWLESSAELVGVNFFKTEKEISINFGCMRKMYDDIHAGAIKGIGNFHRDGEYLG